MIADIQTLKTILANTEKASVVDFDPSSEKLFQVSFQKINGELSLDVISDIHKFSQWVDNKRINSGSKFGIGGYDEYREIYGVSSHFDTDEEPRRLHLGIDIWGPAGTAIYAPITGIIHSFKNNDNFGDYGPTIILKHNIEGFVFHSLYGHLSVNSLNGLKEGMSIAAGQKIAELGDYTVNGGWPPHLHFQLIIDLEGNVGDYPGVCKLSEREKYLANCPDPALLLAF